MRTFERVLIKGLKKDDCIRVTGFGAKKKKRMVIVDRLIPAESEYGRWHVQAHMEKDPHEALFIGDDCIFEKQIESKNELTVDNFHDYSYEGIKKYNYKELNEIMEEKFGQSLYDPKELDFMDGFHECMRFFKLDQEEVIGIVINDKKSN